MRRVEDITEALWGTRVSTGVVSKLNQELYDKIDLWRTRPIEGAFPYVYLDGIVLKRTWAVQGHHNSPPRVMIIPPGVNVV